MDALETVLRPVAKLLNRNIQESTPARELCRDLSGTVVAVRVRNTALAAYFLIDDETLDVATSSSKEPDVVVCGSLITLARMNAKSSEAAIRDGSLDLSGDARLAEKFQKLLNHAKPDVDEELSSLIGDVAAHRLGEISRGIGRWGRDVRSTMGANIREYLQEESRDAPSRYEADKFSKNVGTLRDDVDRLEARVNRLQENS
jgi:ubiquinone biosynthesis protein UbiJ